ncbi:MAG: GtrA family protein [Reyranellaceae bacterium]
MLLAPAESVAATGVAFTPRPVRSSIATRLVRLVRAAVALFVSRRFATFVVFGGLAALVNIGVGKTLYSVPAIAAVVPYWLAVALGAASGMLVNFGLNYTFNFSFQGRSAGAQLRTFALVSVGGISLTSLIAYGLVSLAGSIGLASPVHLGGFALEIGFIAHVTATGLVTFYSYAAHSAFSFNVGLRTRLMRVFSR